MLYIMIDIELSVLFLALRLSKQVELCRLNGDDDFAIFRRFAKIIREYENEKTDRNYCRFRSAGMFPDRLPLWR